MDFYSIVLVVAIVVFFLMLVLMGLLITNATSTAVYPPMASACPDYWSVDSNGNCVFPGETGAATATGDGSTISNIGLYAQTSIVDISSNKPPYPVNLTTDGKTTLSFSFSPSDSRWSSRGYSTTCAQKDWATKYNIVWDGISNYNAC